MNRFLKKNFALLAIISVSVLFSIGLLIYATIINFQRINYNNETDQLVSKIDSINKQKPAPVDENRPLITKDIHLYQKLITEIKVPYGCPIQAAIDGFFSELKYQPPKGEDGKIPPLESITQQRFMELFHADWDQVPQENYAMQDFTLRQFRRRFTNWNKARQTFINKCKDLVVEPLDSGNADAVLLSALGIPRNMRGSAAELKRYMENMRTKISELAAAGNKMVMSFEAGTFGFNMQNPETYALQDYDLIPRHWETFGDLVKVALAADTKILHGIKLRMRPGEGGANSFQNSFESDGDYRISHYTIEITGTMHAIRKFTRLLDNSYTRSRFYIVRSVFLFAEENGAQVMFEQAVQDEDEQSGTTVTRQSSENTGGRGRGRGRRRRGRGAVEVETSQNNNDAETAKRKEEARRREEELRQREMKLPPHERQGYGALLIGVGTEYRAIFDIDYVTLSK